MAYSPAQNRANQKYQNKAYDRLAVRVKKGKREEYKQAAEKNGESLAGMITRLLDQEVERLKE